MPPAPPAFATDRQRLARAGQRPGPPPPAPATDRQRLARPAAAHPVFKPLVVSSNTFVIRGREGTYLGVAFGDGHRAPQLNLYDYLPADRVPHLGNYVLDLTGILPDAIGLDIGVSGGVSIGAGLGGLNILWHTRGEGSRAWYPEVHVYYGYSGSFTVGALFQSLLSPPNAAAAVQLILAWARRYDNNRVGRPAESSWIANGFNWTGTFWSTGFSVPIPPRFTLVGSYYQSFPFHTMPRNTTAWLGVSIGIGVSGKFSVKAPFKPSFKLDLTKVLDFKKLGLSINESKTEYGLIYGNGNDYIPQRHHQDITGWHWPINQNDY